MDIKLKAHILKKRAKELGYDLKLTHAQELVSALYGHKSRHSALLEETKPILSIEDQAKMEVQAPQEENLEFYGIKSFPSDDLELSEKAFNAGLKIGYRHGKEIHYKLEKLEQESIPIEPNTRRNRILNSSLYHGVLKALATNLSISPLHNYFHDLEADRSSLIGGKNMVQKVLRKRTYEALQSIKKKS